MRIGMTKTKWLVGIVAAMAMLGVMACGGADAPAPAAPAVVDTSAIKAAVQEAVAASAQPAQVDTAALKSLVQEAVTGAVPKGTSAADMAKTVEAAVAASAQPGLTASEVEAAIKKATAGQLTAAQVQKIVDASVKATEATVQAAVMAAEKTQAAGQMAFTQAMGELQEAKLLGAARTPVTDPARTAPSLLAKKSANGLFSYRWTGPVPTKFNEAPMLAELVRAGKLPPVKDRLPDEPLVSPPTEAIGKYGGTWRKATLGAAMQMNVASSRLIRFDGDGSGWMENIVKKREVTNGGRVVTYTIRKGHKWSDGQPFTTKDVDFVWNGLMHNIEYETNGFPSYWADPLTKNPPKLDVIDDFTWSFTWDNPAYGVHESSFSVGKSFNSTTYYPYAPSHYLMQFHRDFTKDKAALDKMIKDEGLAEGIDSWPRFLKRIKGSYYENPDVPTLAAWKTVDGVSGPEWIAERNPYYHVVDPAGNQLPYIDRIHLTRVSSAEVVALKAAAGELDWQGRNLSLDKLPLLQKFADQNGYFIYLSKSNFASDAVLFLNQTYALTQEDLDKGRDKLIGDLMRSRGLSHRPLPRPGQGRDQRVLLLRHGSASRLDPAQGQPRVCRGRVRQPEHPARREEGQPASGRHRPAGRRHDQQEECGREMEAQVRHRGAAEAPFRDLQPFDRLRPVGRGDIQAVGGPGHPGDVPAGRQSRGEDP